MALLTSPARFPPLHFWWCRVFHSRVVSRPYSAPSNNPESCLRRRERNYVDWARAPAGNIGLDGLSHAREESAGQASRPYVMHGSLCSLSAARQCHDNRRLSTGPPVNPSRPVPPVQTIWQSHRGGTPRRRDTATDTRSGDDKVGTDNDSVKDDDAGTVSIWFRESIVTWLAICRPSGCTVVSGVVVVVVGVCNRSRMRTSKCTF